MCRGMSALIAPHAIKADIAACKECSIAKVNLPIIEERIEEVNFLLEAMQQSKSITEVFYLWL